MDSLDVKGAAILGPSPQSSISFNIGPSPHPPSPSTSERSSSVTRKYLILKMKLTLEGHFLLQNTCCDRDKKRETGEHGE